MKTGRPRRSMQEFLDLFWRSFVEMDGCWVWTGSTLTTGDGIVLPRCYPPGLGHSEYAHRVSYQLTHNDFNSLLCVCHTCDRPLCIRPDHLFQGTHQDNMADMAAKHRAASGERNAASKLTWAQVHEIRAIWAAGGQSKSAVGRQFGVSHTMIRHIVNGTVWKTEAA